MRVIAGFLCVCISALAFAQARGDVESVGFGGAYRPGCWTPLVVRLTPTTGTTFSGRIEVTQQDLDQDNVVFTRQITLTGNPPSGSVQEYRFWMYFIPQPTAGATMDGNNTRDELTDKLLKVRLCTESGKELVKLPITQTVRPVESMRSGMGTGNRGFKFVLCVYDRNLPNLTEYQGLVGINEDVNYVGTRDIAAGLPDSVIGYDGVDAIVWTDADPFKLSAEQMTALEEFVRRGGKLVLCQDTQTNQWQRNNAKFAMIMPVVVKGIDERDDELDTLRNLAGRANSQSTWNAARNAEWNRLAGPFRYAVADPRPGAVVAVWQQADAKGTQFADQNRKVLPYVVRLALGAGSVTWVAQDLGDRAIVGERQVTTGWAEIWDKVLDWPNDPLPPKIGVNDNALALPYKPNTTLEFGRALLKQMDLPSTSAALIGIAVLFFIVYWVAAGPGSYLVLSRKGKSSMSWFAFAVMAIAATGLTYIIVKLVLRGDAKMQHYSLVRMVPGQPISVRSNFGLYIPRDGYQKIELKEAAADKASYVVAYNLHPAFNTDAAEFPAKQTYYVPVKEMHEQDREAADPKVISVPYRSTLKKFAAHWQGAAAPNLTGGITIDTSEPKEPFRLNRDVPYITGKLVNQTGKRLRMVYIAFHHPAMDVGREDLEARDYVLYVSEWDHGTQIQLSHNFDARQKGFNVKADARLTDKDIVRLRGMILADARIQGAQGNWTDFWYHQFRAQSSFDDRVLEEDDPLTPKSFPILSFYDRLPLSRNERGPNPKMERVDILRRGARYYDLSAAISAGNVVVIAVADSDKEPLPIPLEVQGDRMDKSSLSKGVVYYQFVLPVDRSAVAKPPPATQPTTRPSRSTTKPTSKPVSQSTGN